jgi:RecA/RadA recombinase
VLLDDPNNYVIGLYAEDSDMSRLDGLGFTSDMKRRFRPLTVDPDEDLKFQSAERLLNKILEYCEHDQVKLVIIDSIKALCTTGDLYDKKGGFFDLEKAGPVGERATKFGLFVKQFANRNKKAILFMINQTSDQISTGFSLPYGVADGPDMKTPGGRAKEFYANLRVKTSAKVLYTETEHPLHGARLGEGYEIRYKLVKSKFCGDSATIMHKATSRFMLDPPGFDRLSDVLACADFLKLDAIHRGGGGYWSIYGEKMRGQDTIQRYFQDHPEIIEKLELEISARSGEIYANHTKKKVIEEELLS